MCFKGEGEGREAMRREYGGCTQGSLCRNKRNHLLLCLICLVESLCDLHFRMLISFNLLLNNLFLHYAALFVENNTYTSVSGSKMN